MKDAVRRKRINEKYRSNNLDTMDVCEQKVGMVDTEKQRK